MIQMSDPEIVFLVDSSPEPYGEDGEPLYADLYPIFGGWREFAYWRLSRAFPKPSKEYEDLTERTVFEPDEDPVTYWQGSFLSGYNRDIERPSNYDTPHP